MHKPVTDCIVERRSNITVTEADKKLKKLLKDVEFSSPSAAAAVIHGGQANGLTAWKNPQNKSLKELESV